MFTYLRQLWRSDDLRKRILFTIVLLIIYRAVSHITIPGADKALLKRFLANSDSGGALGIFTALTGGAVQNFSIALLGLSPYINASIILQLCTVVFPKLEALSKEGVQGQQKINTYTRWLSIVLAFLQSYGFLLLLNRGGSGNIVPMQFPAVLAPMLFVSVGCIFVMWLGELITEKGIGNGISLIIFTGIVARMPNTLSTMFVAGQDKMSAFYLFLIISLAMLVAVVLFTDAHRAIPITYANQGAGRGVKANIPIRLNQAGMVPIIFAISLITFPGIIAQFLQTAQRPIFQEIVSFIKINLNSQSPSMIYIVTYFLLNIAFTYFYVSVTFRPEQVAENIQKRGGFIPGIRPGRQTAEMLAKVSNRLNLWGGIFLGLVAIIPLLFTRYSSLSSQDLIISGSGLIIIVGVVLELVRQVNAQLLVHDYEKLV
jgi:preprotein translocase subunit SecY